MMRRNKHSKAFGEQPKKELSYPGYSSA